MVLPRRVLEDSWVYQDIFNKARAEAETKGRVKMAREILLRLGRKKFGQPDEQVLARIAGLIDLESLEALVFRTLDVSSWDELLTASES